MTKPAYHAIKLGYQVSFNNNEIELNLEILFDDDIAFDDNMIKL